MSDETRPPPRRYKEGNDDGSGGYLIGKYRPPESGQFRTGDNRRRGRRSKGTRNFDTDFQEEVSRKVPVRENGSERRVSKQRAAIIRLLDNAYAKGQNPALALVLTHLSRLDDRKSRAADLSQADEALIDDWLIQRAAELKLSDEPGHPDADDEVGDQRSGDDFDHQGGDQ
jgi:hypothetical protein